MASAIVEETARAIRALGIPHKALMAVDELTLRVHNKRRGRVFNTDIRLDRVRDLYDLTVYELDMRELAAGEWNPQFGEIVNERRYAGLCWDQLAEFVGQV